MDLIKYNNKEYPQFQAGGFAAQFAMPYAKFYCKGLGYDVGCMKKEWALPGAIPVDISFDEGYHALNLPPLDQKADYIFSSHCLEHIPNWVEVLEYWHDSLKDGGILFLYLPHYDQEYWRPWNNNKHKNIFTSEIITDWMKHKGFINIFSSGKDLNCSFMVVAEKSKSKD